MPAGKVEAGAVWDLEDEEALDAVRELIHETSPADSPLVNNLSAMQRSQAE